MLYIKQSKIHNRGVFTDCVILKDQIVVVANVLLIPKSDISTYLEQYCFPWNGKQNDCCVCMSNITFANHSNNPNTKIYSVDKEQMTKTFVALKDISSDEEITLKYM